MELAAATRLDWGWGVIVIGQGWQPSQLSLGEVEMGMPVIGCWWLPPSSLPLGVVGVATATVVVVDA